MPKWSAFINALGTAGPPTVQGIYNLGFALRSEIPALFAKYVRVDATQDFTTGEKLQGRTNLGLGTIATEDGDDVAITGGSITGIVDLAIADGGTGASSAPAARTNLGLGNVDNTSDAAKPVSTAQQTALNLKANLASPPLTGTPTAPTAAPGTNTTQVATTAFVAAAVAPISNNVVAFVDFDGVTGTIRSQKNVSSITKNGAGDYTVNFASALLDVNYVFSGAAQAVASGNIQTVIAYVSTSPTGALLLKSTTQCRVAVANASNGAPLDFANVNLVFVR